MHQNAQSENFSQRSEPLAPRSEVATKSGDGQVWVKPSFERLPLNSALTKPFNGKLTEDGGMFTYAS